MPAATATSPATVTATAALQLPTEPVESGQIILLAEPDEGVRVARVTRARRDSLRVETEAGSLEVDSRQPWLALPLRSSSLARAVAQVAALRARVATAEVTLLLDALGDQRTTVGAMAEALLGAKTPEDRAATRIALLSAAGRVILAGHDVRLRTAAEQATYRTWCAAERAAGAALAELRAARSELLTFGRLATTPSPDLVALLESFARGAPAPNAAWEKALIGRGRSVGSVGRVGAGGAAAAGAVIAGAARALADLEVWDGHEDLGLLRSGLLAPWPSSANVGVRLAATPAPAGQAAPSSGEPAPRQLPLCALPLRAIDSVDPDEVDDAVWAEHTADGVRLVVAFASPSLLLTPHSPADLEARRRGVTLYHPRHTCPMLPEPVLAQSSLTTAEARPALVCELLVRADGERTVTRLYEAQVQLTEALVYDDVERQLHSADPPAWLAALRDATAWSEAARIRAGAYLLYRPDIEVRAPSRQPVTLRRAPQSLLARRLIAESMVQACAAVGGYLRGRGVVLPVRTQQIRPDPPLPPGLYTEPADVQTMLGHLGPARTGARAGRHDILGVSDYVQISSPLRRYPDLLAHYQIIAHLRGERPPFDRGQLDKALSKQRAAVRARRAAGRRGQRYFQLLELARQGLGAPLHAQVIRAGGPQGRSVAFDPTQVLQIDLPGYLGPVGTWLDLETTAVDASEGRLEVRLSGATQGP